MKTKVCGLTTPADAFACIEAGVDWIGLNFHPTSVRFVTAGRAAEICHALGDRVGVVGLFVDRPAAEVLEVARTVGLDYVQLHGDEPPEYLATLPGVRVVKAFRLKDAESAAAIRRYLERSEALGHPPHAILVDAYVSGQAGGTGVAIAEELLGGIPSHPRLILAGGLTPENVAERAGRVGPWMVDVASGVESEPGRKCPVKIAAFADAVRRSAAPRAMATASPENPPPYPPPQGGREMETLPPCGGG